MITRKYETIVGMFVLAALAALFIMVLIIAQQEGLWQQYVEYRAIFKNVAGLKKGSDVRLAGVTVGSVSDTLVGKDGRITVVFQVVSKDQSQIRADTKANIGYIGLLGDRSLDLTPGSPEQPQVPPKGIVTAVEPLDIGEFLTKAAPLAENLQKILKNIASLTDSLMNPEGNLNQMVTHFKNVAEKIDQGKGSLGLIVNDPKLHQEIAQGAESARKFLGDLESSKGLLGTVVRDQNFRDTAKKAMDEAQAALANLKEASAGFPGMAKKTEDFLGNLDKAGEGLPELVTSGEGMVSDADKTVKAAQRSWLLRRYVPKARERTLSVEREVK